MGLGQVENAAQALTQPKYKVALVELLYQLADDELVLGHRDSEWLGLAPHVEEDVAFASVAQDEVGHATLMYRLLEELGEGKADDLAFLRTAAARSNSVLVERPNGEGTYLQNPQFEWGYTIARHYCYDLFDQVRLEALTHSSYTPLAQAAAKLRREERYHLLHHETWLQRLAGGSDQARDRLIAGLEAVWPDLGDLFSLGAHENLLLEQLLITQDSAQLRSGWLELVQPKLQALNLPWPGMPPAGEPGGRDGQHSAALSTLLETMGEVYRTAPGASW